MKIFHIGICVYPESIWLAAALKKASKYIECLPDTNDNLILQMAIDFQPDLTFMQIQAPNIISPETIRQLPGVVINWTGDCRQPIPQWYYQMAPYCVTCFSNQVDVNVFKSKGLKSEYLQIGIDPNIFNKYPPGNSGAEVVFMVNNYGGQFPLGQYRKQTGQILKKRYGDRFKWLGNGWQQADGHLNHSQIEESKYYNGSKIGINVSNYNLDRYFSDRLIRIMGSGCFCLTHRYTGIEKDFVIGEHLDVFNDHADMLNKIDYYLENEQARKRIADNGYNHIHSTFTTDNMVENALKIYEQYKL